MESKDKKIAVVIGAGISGIAAAIRLTAKGYKVICFEANAYPGGKLSEVKGNGFRFDAGPSLFTMPQYVEELFKLHGKDPKDYFQYQKLENTGIYYFVDGTRMVAHSNLEKFAVELEEKLNTPKEKTIAFFKKSKNIFNITYHVFLERSIHRLNTYLRWATIKSIFHLPQIDAFRTMNDSAKDLFEDIRAQQYFNRYATYNGSNPFRAPATLHVIPHLEHAYGAFLPVGGMVAITNSLVKFAQELGVEFVYNTKVEEILHDAKNVKGVKTSRQEEVLADVVFSNMDMVYTYRKLLPNFAAPEKLLNQEKSSSALIFYWGIQHEFNELDVHNFFFSANYKEEFNSIDNFDIYEDPTVYVNITSKLEKADAPKACENWFVMINVPHQNNQNWELLISKARKNIIKKLNAMLSIDLEPLIIFEETLDPRTIESKTSSYKGALYGNSSNNKYAAFLRHANKSSKLNGLYFCGGSVHPGGGIPLALLSAKIATDYLV
jgi:phytoene desaturase